MITIRRVNNDDHDYQWVCLMDDHDWVRFVDVDVVVVAVVGGKIPAEAAGAI